MYKKWHECAKLLALFIKPIVFVHVLIAVTALDLKVPVNNSLTQLVLMYLLLQRYSHVFYISLKPVPRRAPSVVPKSKQINLFSH